MLHHYVMLSLKHVLHYCMMLSLEPELHHICICRMLSLKTNTNLCWNSLLHHCHFVWCSPYDLIYHLNSWVQDRILGTWTYRIYTCTQKYAHPRKRWSVPPNHLTQYKFFWAWCQDGQLELGRVLFLLSHIAIPTFLESSFFSSLATGVDAMPF